ncbi:S-adenosylmethionine decarboxylase proenzyme [[Candida] anglica]|uniref:adenosylmethionine decarboxylase n=1 Tax=[Candida] anglica TaxID=148631 RepID=A0ABP0EID2_9ASCO
MVAPAYHEDTYVDTELSANLDSTFAFEGPEKLLELWFFDSDKSIPDHVAKEGLRSIPLEKWVDVLDLVSCKILSMNSSDEVDAYLLSESSLFVFAHKIILKTCGTTTTLACLDKLFELVNEYLFNSMDKVYQGTDILRIFYSRRSFMFPLKQKHVHKDWKHEVALLNNFFGNGKSYVVGDFASDDHWYLYMGGNSPESNDSNSSTDQTFEILMTELDPIKAKKFVTTRKPGGSSLVHENEEDESDLGHDLGLEMMSETKLDSVFAENHCTDVSTHMPSPSLSDSLEFEEDTTPIIKECSSSKFQFIHDAFAFTPCGFSSNSISRVGNYYYTLHITPESGWSYASFETNYPFYKSDTLNITDVLLRVLNIFEPGKFSATLITEQGDDANVLENFNSLSNCSDLLLKSFSKFGYEKQERVLYDLKGNYKLLYLNYAKISKE